MAISSNATGVAPFVPEPAPLRGPSGPILVVSAFTPELAPLRDALRRRGGTKGAIVCLPVGIGAVDAAVGTCRALARWAPRLVLFLGTAGSYGREPAVGWVALAHRVRLASTAVARGHGYLPAPMVRDASVNSVLQRELRRKSGAHVVLADVATPLAITKTSALARRLSDATDCAIENLEAFAIARAANLARIPFAAVLGISNRVGPRAHVEWRRNQDRAIAAASAVIEAYLDRFLKATRAATPGSPRVPNRSRPPRRLPAG